MTRMTMISSLLIACGMAAAQETPAAALDRPVVENAEASAAVDLKLERELETISASLDLQPEDAMDAIGESDADGLAVDAPSKPVIDVVFVLDTTGSMGGLIEGAKQKIWSIASTIASADPTPTIRIGLVGYRDRTDEYVTKITPLTEDLDLIYADLLAFEAAGGGDGPESVNQALFEAVNNFEWSEDESTLKLIYLVGDAPPHMDYENEVQYPETCEQAAAAGIIINTIQCGTWAEATTIWKEIALNAEGEFLAIEQNGGVAVIETPFDSEMAELDLAINGTACFFGTEEEMRQAWAKDAVGREIAEEAAPAAAADRAEYKLGVAGARTLVADNDLVQQWIDGRMDASRLNEIPEGEIPDELKDLSEEERVAFIEENAMERQRIQTRLRELSVQRAEFIAAKRREMAGSTRDGFDAGVVESLRRQAAKIGLEIEAPEAAEASGSVEETEGSEEPMGSVEESSEEPEASSEEDGC